ncbi:MAG TPA: tetratricopeptide repeat protein [Actinospica sp.]|nr:tetratricopeptide repeat protein [Actinospica sp.]
MTTRQLLESRPETLWRRIDPLHRRFDEGKRLAAVHAEALAEAYFRIGVHRGTPTATALDVLARAHRLDSANPKHPYHLGLLHLRHGRPEAAVRWLAAAARLSPVNHRVQAHLSLAYRELHALRQGTAGYGNEDQAKAERIAAAVREGSDVFELGDGETSNTVALIRPGVCRWSGIHDLEADVTLRARTTDSARKTLAAELRDVAELAAHRQGGAAAFAVLAVQWLVYGYPPATIRRLAKPAPEDDGACARLLGLVCELFEADLAELPTRLAACLAEGSLPDVLVALIHRQRMFWRPLRFPDLGALAAARDFAEGDAARHVKALEAAWRKLSPEPPEPMADAPDREAESAAQTPPPDEQLAAFEQAEAAMTDLAAEINRQIKLLAKQRFEAEPDLARVAGDRDLLGELVGGLEKLRTGWLEDLHRLMPVDPARLAMESAEFDTRYRECERKLQESITKLLNPLKRLDRTLRSARTEHPAVEPRPSREALDLAVRLAELKNADADPDEPAAEKPAPLHPRTPPPPPPSTATGKERVAHAIAAAEGALDANFAEAWQSLDAYPAALRERDALVLLRGYIGGRQAEAEFRLGRPTAARRRWAALLADDPVHPDVLRNLAVAHTSAGDPTPAAEAWQRHLDAIYLRDLLNGDVRRGAAARAELHSVFAASFGTAPLCCALIPDADPEETARQIPPLLARRAKVAAVAAHLRLEELNHTYAHRGPTLLLGIARNAPDAVAEARGRRATALAEAVTGLPERIRGPFEKECLRLLDDAGTEAARAQGRFRRPGDDAEEAAHRDWVQRRVRWKYGILTAIAGADADWPLTEYSGAVIGNLRLIDELALDPTDEILCAYLRRFQPGAEPAAFIKRLDDLSDYAAAFAYQRILLAGKAADSAADVRAFADLFQRVGRSWGRNPVPEVLLEKLDDPVEMYAETVDPARQIIWNSGRVRDPREREIVTAAVPVLERWLDRLPGATGPARLLARMHGALGGYEQALRVLNRAAAEAFSALGREKVRRERPRLDVARGAYPSAVAFLRAELTAHPDDEELRVLLTNAFARWIESKEDVPTPETITEAFAPWTDEESVRYRRLLTLNAAVVRYQALPEGSGMESFVVALRALVSADPDHLHAHCQLSVALHGFAWECRENMIRTFGAERSDMGAMVSAALKECEQRTALLLPRLVGEEYAEQRTRLTEILDAVREALG